MRIAYLIPALVAAALLPSAATALQTAPNTTTEEPSGAAPAKPEKPAKPKKICRTSEVQTYSRMAPRVCKTQAEWDATPAPSVDPSVRSIKPD